MAGPNIVLTRIDNRLIHGQVGCTWTMSVGANLILVADDEAAGDALQQQLMAITAKSSGASPRFWTVQKTIDTILDMLKPEYIRGLTLLGGEPFEPQNQRAILELLRQMKEKYPKKSIWAFSGYLFDRDILSGKLGDWEITKEYLSYLDVLVDGPFVEAKKNLSLRFRGSENQRIIDVPASLSSGEIVLWQDWQGERKET
jgi:anaerobic ribonucleoside-triphosphate reductase activating protein